MSIYAAQIDARAADNLASVQFQGVEPAHQLAARRCANVTGSAATPGLCNRHAVEGAFALMDSAGHELHAHTLGQLAKLLRLNQVGTSIVQAVPGSARQ